MNSNSKKFKMICFINDYEAWDDTIHEHACKFYVTYSVHPNLMLSSKVTWGKIDEFANLYNPENILTPDDGIEDNDPGVEFKSISCFATVDYSIEFCLDIKVNEGYFILVFDEDPIFDGEHCEYSDDENVEVYKRIA